MKKSLRSIAKTAYRKQMKSVDDIYGSDNESKRKMNSALDARGVPNRDKNNYIAEKDMKGRSAKYLKNKKKTSSSAEERRQSRMVMEADYADQSKGAEAYINKKYGKAGAGFYPSDFSTYKDFENAVLDVMSESEVSSKFPSNVWELAAKRYTKRLYTESEKQSPFKKLPQSTKSGAKKR